MKTLLVFGSDHRGNEMRQTLIRIITERFSHLYDILDCGTHQGEQSVDYPAYAHTVTKNLLWWTDAATNPNQTPGIGVLICGSGIGIAMAANKTPGIRAATCRDATDARMAREHNDANVLCVGADVTAPWRALEMVETFLAAEFEGGRHQPRIDMIEHTWVTA